MNFSIVILLVTFMWQNVRAEYGASCTNPDNLSGKCVPIASCTYFDARLKNIKATGGSLPPDFKAYLLQSNCGLFDNVRHVCCAEDQIQYNAKVIEELRNLNCGKFIMQMKIIGGYEVYPWTRPWMALLGYRNSNIIEFKCGGTLISDRYVLTAAHCVKGLEKDLKIVRLGEHKISQEIDCQELTPFNKKCFNAIDLNIDKMIIHENYHQYGLYDDIALLRLSNPVDLNGEMNKFISPICLPITDTLKNKINTIQEFLVPGWGVTKNGSSSDGLMETRVFKRSFEECSSALQTSMRDSQICAGGVGSKDSCKGDSGGPLQASSQYILRFPKRFVQFGMVSFGLEQCGTPGFPAVYTNVAYYIQWITDKMAGQ